MHDLKAKKARVFDIANQLLNVARLSRHSLKLIHDRQSFYYSQSKVGCRNFPG